jgi:hypothetical protein
VTEGLKKNVYFIILPFGGNSYLAHAQHAQKNFCELAKIKNYYWLLFSPYISLWYVFFKFLDVYNNLQKYKNYNFKTHTEHAKKYFAHAQHAGNILTTC